MSNETQVVGTGAAAANADADGAWLRARHIARQMPMTALRCPRSLAFLHYEGDQALITDGRGVVIGVEPAQRWRCMPNQSRLHVIHGQPPRAVHAEMPIWRDQLMQPDVVDIYPDARRLAFGRSESFLPLRRIREDDGSDDELSPRRLPWRHDESNDEDARGEEASGGVIGENARSEDASGEDSSGEDSSGVDESDTTDTSFGGSSETSWADGPPPAATRRYLAQLD